MKNLKLASIAILACVLVLSSCKKDEAVATKTLYERLGGVSAISAVVDQFLTNVVGDSRINGRFAATVSNSSRTQLLRFNLIDQIGEASGGPLKYKGKTMTAAHTGMMITDTEFNALVEDLVNALNTFKVPSTEQTELLTILGGLKGQIVNK